MSAWEGSAAQERWEDERKRREERIARVLRDNPSLTRDDAALWVKKLEQDERAAARTACCRCRSPERAEIVNVGGVVGPCACGCHGQASR